MTEAIINLQALLVKSYLLNALLINRKAFPIGYHGAQVLNRPPMPATARVRVGPIPESCAAAEKPSYSITSAAGGSLCGGGTGSSAGAATGGLY
jgi:hypothetical protein